MCVFREMARDAAKQKLSDFSPERCHRLQRDYRLTSEQVTACIYHPELMGAVFLGAQRAVKQCQLQNARSTWNCSTNETGSLFGVVLKNGKSPAMLIGNNQKILYVRSLGNRLLVAKWLIICC